MVSLEYCDATEIINPYSNPYFYGTKLVNNLWTTVVNKIPFIYVPIINNTVYVELIKKYYQPELYRASSDSKFGSADEFTPPYLRTARKTLLLLEALRCYTKLATEVSELFLPEAQEKIKIRLFYATSAKYISQGLFNFEEWLQQLSRGNVVADYETITEYQELFAEIKNSANNCITYIQSYANNLDKNPGWRLEQGASEVKEMLPVIEYGYSIVQYISQRLLRIQELIDIYSGKKHTPAISKNMVLPPFTPIKTSGIYWIITHQLDLFLDCLKAAIDNKAIRDAILKVLNANFVQNDNNGAVIGTIEILNDEQLLKIYSYVLKILKDQQVKQNLYDLRYDDKGVSTNSFLITRKKDDNKLRDPQQIRTLSMSISKNGFKLGLHSSRKTSKAKLLPKYKGHASTVTPTFDISPYSPDRLEKMQASKSIDLCDSKDQAELDASVVILKQSMQIAKEMGHLQIHSGSTYLHYKPRMGLRAAGFRVAARITEDWAISTMQKFAEYECSKNHTLLINDTDYQLVKNSADAAGIAKVKYNIIIRLIDDLLNDMVKLHEKLKVVHRDIKPDNILIYIENGKLRARLADFDMSMYMHSIQASDCQPVASCGFASPQVVGFTVMTPNKIIYTDLFNQLKAKNPDKSYFYASFGRELLYANWNAIANKEEYDNMKPDFKDDTFSLGVTLFIFLTGHYPTVNIVPNKIAYSTFKYMNVQDAYKKLPQFKEFLEGLLMLDRDKRFSAADAYSAFKRIDANVLSSASKPLLTI